MTPVKIRSKRCRGSPTGETPNHPAKQIHKVSYEMSIDPSTYMFTQSRACGFVYGYMYVHTCTYIYFNFYQNAGSRWEEREIEFLTSYLRTNHPSDPIPISFWNELSRSMNQALKTSRTGRVFILPGAMKT